MTHSTHDVEAVATSPEAISDEVAERCARAFDHAWNPHKSSQARYEWEVYDRSKGTREEVSSRRWRDARVAAMRVALVEFVKGVKG